MKNKMREIREKKDLSIKELAELVNVTDNYIRMIENGRTPGFKLSGKIASILDSTVDEIFFQN